ncbi:MAG: winged helix-turn-helix domain-containing protein [Sciscionella sp.]
MSGVAELPTLTAAAARRAVLAAQGFTDSRPAAAATRRHLNRVLERVQLIQLDSVNVAVRAHYMPLFSRLGPYDTALLDEAAWSHSNRRPRLLVEYWAHEASLLPIGDWPLLRWRMRDLGAKVRRHYGTAIERHPGLVDEVLAAVKDLGPLGAGTLERELGTPGRQGEGAWWNRSATKMVCEALFASGELTTAARPGFQRLYDLPERVLPPEILAEPEPARSAAVRALVERSARALGVAAERDLRDYYRLGPEDGRRAVAELTEAGVLRQVAVHGWRRPAYRHVDARLPRRVSARALLCPFDPLVWERERTQRLFGFRYRIEIYVPEHKRVHGYYVFPFLLDDALVARVDLKADRACGVLRVRGAFGEPGIDAVRVVGELGEELHAMARWLELEGVAVEERGDLAAALRRSCR